VVAALGCVSLAIARDEPPAARAAHGRGTDGLELHVGRSFFSSPWVAAPSSTTARDGLGPLFNAHSCSACHPRGERGRAAQEAGEAPVSLLARLGLRAGGGMPGAPEPRYGTQLQTRGVVSGPARVPAEGTLAVEYETIRLELADGERVELRRPLPALRDLAYGAIDPVACISLRVAPSLRGVGVLASLPDEAILARADPGDRDGDGISGRPRIVADPETGAEALGRFGHRAAQPTLRRQVAAAFRDDLGITSVLFPEQPCTPAESACLGAPSGASRESRAEIEERILDAVTAMTARLAAPEPRAPRPGDERGRDLFGRAGCASCHVPSPIEAAGSEPAEHRPHTDLLLHDLGPGLADDCDEPGASGAEWRTAPLWGLAAVAPDRHGLLHDGRARSVTEAILWHGGEAEASRRAFAELARSDREDLAAFVASR
jgi:CxxC motif-containing protein (DUF1111 family)